MQEQVDILPKKDYSKRLRITEGGDRLDYYEETSTAKSSLEIEKY